MTELVITLFAIGIGGGGGVYGKHLLDKWRLPIESSSTRADRTNGRMDRMNGRMSSAREDTRQFLTKQKFTDAREACRKEVLDKLSDMDVAIRGDGKIKGNPGLVATVESIFYAQQVMANTIEKIRMHQKNGGG